MEPGSGEGPAVWERVANLQSENDKDSITQQAEEAKRLPEMPNPKPSESELYMYGHNLNVALGDVRSGEAAILLAEKIKLKLPDSELSKYLSDIVYFAANKSFRHNRYLEQHKGREITPNQASDLKGTVRYLRNGIEKLRKLDEIINPLADRIAVEQRRRDSLSKNQAEYLEKGNKEKFSGYGSQLSSSETELANMKQEMEELVALKKDVDELGGPEKLFALIPEEFRGPEHGDND